MRRVEVKVKREVTDQVVSTEVFIGAFHQWIGCDGGVVAVVEKDDGTVVLPWARDVRFRDRFSDLELEES